MSDREEYFVVDAIFANGTLGDVRSRGNVYVMYKMRNNMYIYAYATQVPNGTIERQVRTLSDGGIYLTKDNRDIPVHRTSGVDYNAACVFVVRDHSTGAHVETKQMKKDKIGRAHV